MRSNIETHDFERVSGSFEIVLNALGLRRGRDNVSFISKEKLYMKINRSKFAPGITPRRSDLRRLLTSKTSGERFCFTLHRMNTILWYERRWAPDVAVPPG